MDANLSDASLFLELSALAYGLFQPGGSRALSMFLDRRQQGAAGGAAAPKKRRLAALPAAVRYPAGEAPIESRLVVGLLALASATSGKVFKVSWESVTKASLATLFECVDAWLETTKDDKVFLDAFHHAHASTWFAGSLLE